MTKFKQYKNADGGTQYFRFTDVVALADSFEFMPRQTVLGTDGHLYETMMHTHNGCSFVYAVSKFTIDGDYVAITNPDFKVYALAVG